MRKIIAVMAAGSLLAGAALCGCSNPNQTQSSLSSDYSAAADKSSSLAGKEADSSQNQSMTAAQSNIKKNVLRNENFTDDGTFKYYSENGKAASLEGIDVSSYSGSIDWNRVKDSGVDFVMVRLGGRGYGDDGALYQDDRAAEYIQGAQAAGIKAGGYFFSQAITEEEAAQEADKVKEILGEIQPDFPIAYDLETIKDDTARTDNLSAAQATACANAFCRQIAGHGYTPMIYADAPALNEKYDTAKLAEYTLWYCEYADRPVCDTPFSMWQYSKTGHVDGVEGTVDLNICFTNLATYAN